MNFKLLKQIILDKLKLSSYHRRRKKYDIGEHSYICKNTKLGNVKIGKYCSIADYISLCCNVIKAIAGISAKVA